MGDKENLLWKLYGMITDINPNEIANQISRDNLSGWCNAWRIAAKEIGRGIGEQFKEQQS